MRTPRTSREDLALIADIARRAADFAASLGHSCDRHSLMMDIEYAHAETPLRLVELLHASDSDITHDVFGIHRHIDRHTGKMGDCFSPRYTV